MDAPYATVTPLVTGRVRGSAHSELPRRTNVVCGAADADQLCSGPTDKQPSQQVQRIHVQGEPLDCRRQ